MELDQRQNSIIEHCKYISPNINEYFENQQYYIDATQSEEVTPDFLVNTAVNMLVDELATIGISTNMEMQDLIDNSVDLDIMFAIREKFDANNFLDLLKTLAEDRLFEYNAVLENTELAEDLFINITNYFCDIFPSNIGWEKVARGLDFWYSTDQFAYHISAIQNRLENYIDPNKIYISENNLELVTKFLNHFDSNIKELNLYIQFIIDNFKQVNYDKLILLCKKYDRDKLSPNLLPYFAEYYNSPTIEEPEFVKNHHLRTSHHIEYWKGKSDIKLTFEQATMCVLSMALDRLDESKMIEKIKEFKPYADTSVFEYMINLSKIDYEILRGVK